MKVICPFKRDGKCWGMECPHAMPHEKDVSPAINCDESAFYGIGNEPCPPCEPHGEYIELPTLRECEPL